ncbi:MAG: endolytic transglycosylase MltG [Bryobacteraceae bacterium]|jgi:UPF0755 protein
MKCRYFVVAAMATVLVALALVAVWILTPRVGPHQQAFVVIPRGANARQISRILADGGVIEHRLQFLLVRALRPRAKLKAGEYMFKERLSMWKVFDRIVRGDVFYYVLVVPEGNSTFDIAQTLERQKIMPPAAFLEAARDPALVRDLDPRAPSLEGYLFPDTYHVTRHTTPAQLCRMMTDRFRKAWNALGPPAAKAHEVVTLASLVEREAKLPAERALIASVFANRLRLGMALQCDPTAIYAAQVEDRYRGVIHRSDLDSRQAYNTYQHAGLPPGPIANPGMASLQAALEPAATDFLYFVVRPDGSGGHQFSKELAQHTRAVEQYRRGVREQERQAGGVARRS